jgi:hypothetical protein
MTCFRIARAAAPLAFSVAAAFLLPHAVVAQGVQTGEMRGSVTDVTGGLVPGVTVEIASPVLQGTRSTTTDLQGGYIFRGLPPGTYAATFSLAGFTTVERMVEVPLGSVAEVSVTLTAGAVVERVTVVGQAESLIQQTQVGVNMTKDLIDVLPIGRTPYGVAAIMPGLTTNTPNAGQLTISGGFGYDNIFLVDGTDVNDNLFGVADALFVEDAIDEVQVLTGGIPAEYGRFSGGIVNVITRRGGNTFSGTFRETWTNPTWSGRSPFDELNDTPRTSTLNEIHEGTAGGPILRDRLWFFVAGRIRDTAEDETFPQTGIGYQFRNKNRRGGLKLTATIGNSHTISGQYLNNWGSTAGPAFSFTIDPAAIMRPTYPNSQVATTYRGTVGSRGFVEAQYSQKQSGFRDAGGTSTRIVDSPIFNANPVAAYNAPYFDATDPDDRDNRQFTGSFSYFTSRSGQHDLKAGFEHFVSTNKGGNSQTSTGFVFGADYVVDSSGKPLLDAGGRLIPMFVPLDTTVENWLPVRGAKIDIRTTSLYIRDHWSINRHWSVDLGTRAEIVRSNATGDIVGVDTRTIVPRLGVAFDPAGDGDMVFHSTYGHYAGKYNEAQFSRNTNVGNPDVLLGVYLGPPGQGRDFAPGFDPDNYLILGGAFPAANVFFERGLSSPITREFTLQAGSRIGSRAHAKVVYVKRHVTDFIEDFVTLETGSTAVSKGGISDVFSNIVYRNSSLPKRQYDALEIFGQYRPTNRWTWNAAWTVQLRNRGNFEGEADSRPAISSAIGEYPEAFNERRHFPIGRLAGFQRHGLRLWNVYAFDLGAFGNVGLAGFFTLDSPLTYSLRTGSQPITAIQRSLLEGYVSQPTGQSLYFGPRGSEQFRWYSQLDLAATYNIPRFKRASPWLKLELYNALDNQRLVTWNVTVLPDPASPLDELGLPTGYIKGPRFGQAQSNGNYLTPRTFAMAFGVRF